MQNSVQKETLEGWILVPPNAKGKRSLRVANTSVPFVSSHDARPADIYLALSLANLSNHLEGEVGSPAVAPSKPIFCGNNDITSLQLVITGKSTECIEEQLDLLEKEMWENDPEKDPILLDNSSNSTSHSNLPASPFHSLHSDDSFLKQIEGLEVEQPGDSNISLPSDASNRKGKDNDEEDSASTSRKRARN